MLFLLGFVTLFLELVLIRYLAGNVWNLGYFPNLVLMAACVGMGIGFVFHQRIGDQVSPACCAMASVAILAVALIVHVYRPALPFLGNWGAEVGGELFFTDRRSDASTDAGQGLFAAWFAGVVVIFALVSQRTAKVFRGFPALQGYALDVGGSCCGVLSFMVISWLQAPAWSWFVVAALLMAGALPSRKTRAVAALALLATAALAWHQDHLLLGQVPARGELEVSWSPYQKVEYTNHPGDPHAIYVNGIPHQFMMTADQIRTSVYTAFHAARRGRKDVPAYKRVLIIGAGSGNDVAAALASGAEHVDAVEIDPVIARLGREHHPCKPYDDPRVNLIIDDGRAFMTRSTEHYDLIIYALTDSLVKVSAMTQLRLENYLFTVESVQRAWQLLTPTGDIVFYNYYRQRWLIEKIARVAYAATGNYPLVRTGFDRDFAAILVGPHTHVPPPPNLDTWALALSTDDWPFLYLVERAVPAAYQLAMLGCAGIVAALLLFLAFTGKSEQAASSLRVRVAFLLMGLAFMLLETKSITQFSLLFGTTWLTSSLVFLAILTLVLLANALAARLSHGPRALAFLYALLMLSCVAGLFVPLRNLLGLEDAALRFVAASLLTFGPIFFANVIYSLAFRNVAVPEHVFGWNLLGATLGGVVEYASMSLGYARLGWIVAGAYTGVFLLVRSGDQRVR